MPTKLPAAPVGEDPAGLEPQVDRPEDKRLSVRNLPLGALIEIPAEVMLRIETSSTAGATVDPMTSLAIRGVPGLNLRVVRGDGVELHKDGPASWRLVWPNGMLFLELPARQTGLEILGIPGSVGLSGYTGPFSCEEIRGGLTVHGAAAPFRIREVQGTVRLLRLSLRDGISTISNVSHDVEIETAADASVTVRASSQPGPHDSGAGLASADEKDAGHGGRRGVWRIGTGTAQLNVGQVRGQLRLHPANGAGVDVP